MSLNITDFDDALRNWQRQVSQFSSGESIDIENQNNNILSKININSNMVYYVLVPIIIIIILYLLKPCFIMTETTTDNSLSTVSEKKINFKKLVISTIICTSIISLIIFSYKYKKPVWKYAYIKDNFYIKTKIRYLYVDFFDR